MVMLLVFVDAGVTDGTEEPVLRISAGVPKDYVDAAGLNNANIAQRSRPTATTFPVVDEDGEESQVPCLTFQLHDHLDVTFGPGAKYHPLPTPSYVYLGLPAIIQRASGAS